MTIHQERQLVPGDAQIQEDVLHELRWDARVDATSIGIAVQSGIVTLTGTVASYAGKVAAQEGAHRVAGVLDVANDLQVRLPDILTRTDTDIARAVRLALEWDVLVPDERIHSTVADGWVTLEGSVDTDLEREDAERAIARLIGVRGVSNRLEVEGTPGAESEAVEGEIQAALERRALDTAHRIHVAVQDGTAVVSGVVHLWSERDAVLAASRLAPGVRTVVDRLQVDPTA